MKMCDACTKMLALVPVQEGDMTRRLCLECVTRYQHDRPDTGEPVPGFLREFEGTPRVGP